MNTESAYFSQLFISTFISQHTTALPLDMKYPLEGSCVEASTGAHCSHHHTYRSPCPHLGRQGLGIKPEAVDIGRADILSSPALPRIRPACMPFWNSGSQRQRLSMERAQEKEDVGSQTQESELHSIPLTEDTV